MSNKTQNDNPAKTAWVPKPDLRTKSRWFVLGGAGLLVLVFSLLLVFDNKSNAPASVCQSNPALDTIELTVEGRKFIAEVAKTGEEQQQGLSGRDCMDQDRAMLFPYDSPGNYCYWMKDMLFAIDMIWLDKDKKIVTITPSVQPDSYPATFCPSVPAQFVVEVNGGQAAASNWQNGTPFTFAL